MAMYTSRIYLPYLRYIIYDEVLDQDDETSVDIYLVSIDAQLKGYLSLFHSPNRPL